MEAISSNLNAELMRLLHEKYQDRLRGFLMPPPIYTEMGGEVHAIDLENGALSIRFPVPEKYLNPYRIMQGGMIAAAIDNALGPLSMLVAPPNVTRSLEVKYSQPAVVDMAYILIEARLVERKEPKLLFEAKVLSPDGTRLATCKAMHWIVGEA